MWQTAKKGHRFVCRVEVCLYSIYHVQIAQSEIRKKLLRCIFALDVYAFRSIVAWVFGQISLA